MEPQWNTSLFYITYFTRIQKEAYKSLVFRWEVTTTLLMTLLISHNKQWYNGQTLLGITHLYSHYSFRQQIQTFSFLKQPYHLNMSPTYLEPPLTNLSHRHVLSTLNHNTPSQHTLASHFGLPPHVKGPETNTLNVCTAVPCCSWYMHDPPTSMHV